MPEKDGPEVERSPESIAGDLEAFEQETPLELAFVGDICLAMGVKEAIRTHGPAYPFEKIASAFTGADAVVGNLECCLVDERYFETSPVGMTAVPTNLAGGLRTAGFDILNLANNHILDAGAEGLASTIEYLERNGIRHFGANFDLDAAEQALIVDVKGKIVTFLGACDVSGIYAAAGRPGVAPLRLSRLVTRIRALAEQAHLVVVVLHGDLEFSDYPQPSRVRASRALIDAGAHLIVQHHPHVCQGVEEYQGGLIAYSLGNCVFQVSSNKYLESRTGTDEGFVLNVSVNFESGRPVLTWKGTPFGIDHTHRPCLYNGQVAAQWRERIDRLSAGLTDPSMLRSWWRVRCRAEAMVRLSNIYWSMRRYRWKNAFDELRHVLGSAEERRWIYGLISGGLV